MNFEDVVNLNSTNKIKNTNKETYELTKQQKSLWLEQLLNPESASYNIPIMVSFDGKISNEILFNAAKSLDNRFRILKTSIINENGSPLQIINNDVKENFSYIKVNNKKELENRSKELASKPFNLSGKLYRVVNFYNVESNKSSVLIVFHHIISDGTSIDLYLNHLENEYNNLLNNKRSIQTIKPDYLDYSEWNNLSNKNVIDSEVETWGTILKNHTHYLNLPTDYSRKNLVESQKGDRISFEINSDHLNKLNELSIENNVSLFSILLSVYYIILGRNSNQEDVTTNVPFANRVAPGVSNLMGYFVNTLPLPITIESDKTFKEFALNINELVSKAIDNQQASFNDLVKYLNPNRSPNYLPLAQTMFVYQNTNESILKFGRLNGVQKAIFNGYTKNDINMTLTPKKDKLFGFIEFRKNLFNEKTINRFINDYKGLLSNIIDNYNSKIKNLSFLNNTESKIYNKQKPIKYSINENLPEAFRNIVQNNGNSTAVKFKNKELSYFQLDKLSNKFANYLRKEGVKKNDRVALYIDRSENVIIAILGILKLGATYVPIDASYPTDRIKHILSDSKAVKIVTQDTLKKNISDEFETRIIYFNGYKDTKISDEFNLPIIDNTNDAYIIYTSGSTGLPKGVRVSHKNVLRLIKSTDELYKFNKNDVWSMFHSYAFDVSVWEIWGALLHGSKLIVVSQLVTRSTDEFYNLVSNEQVTVLSQTPSAFESFDQVDKQNNSNLSLKYVVFGGEKVIFSKLKDWFKRHDEKIKLINMYGITETTVHSSFHQINKHEVYSDKSESNVGYPLPDLLFTVRDKFGNLVRNGTVGELYVSGDGVSNGYLNRDKLNKTKFININGVKTYKSGDLVQKLENGFNYIGRNDFQVKIRGFRIELGEITNKLLNNSKIENAYVKVLNDKTAGKQIVAYYISKDNNTIDTFELKNELGNSLPDYMIPNAFVQLKEFPMTSNGKIDSKVLPDPKTNGIEVKNAILPRTAVEEKLLEIWEKVLNRNDFGVTDSFFDLGGHSLMAVNLMSKIQKSFNKNFPISLLFTNQTIEKLAQKIISDDKNELLNPLVKFNTANDLKDNLYIVHPGMGQVMVYKELSERLRENNINLFAFQAPGLYGEQKSYRNMDELAKHYVEELVNNDNLESYNLSGYCVGGSIAVEMAHILEEMGKKVNSVQLIDIRPAHYQGKLSKGYISNYFVLQLIHSFDSVDIDVKDKVKTLPESKLNSMSETDIISYLLNIVKSLKIVDENYDLNQMKNWYTTWKNIILGMNDLKVNKINAPIYFYYAEDGDYNGNEWNGYSNDKVISKKISGDHYSILRNNNVDKLSGEINGKI